jgi:transposase-like protein
MEATHHSAAFKARVALEAIRDEKTLAALSAHHDVRANQITSWKNELLSRGAEILGSSASGELHSQQKIRELHEKVGEASMEKDFLELRFPARAASDDRSGREVHGDPSARTVHAEPGRCVPVRAPMPFSPPMTHCRSPEVAWEASLPTVDELSAFRGATLLPGGER